MKTKMKDVLNGIADGIFPSIRNAIKDNEVNRARLTASLISWSLAIAYLKGWIKLSDVLSFLSTMMM